MKMKFLIAIAALLLICCYPAKSQTDTTKRDKYTLLTMPYNKRPLSLYKGQLQVNAGYKLAVRSRSFDSNGNVIDLKTNGNSSVINYFGLEVKYGLLDFIELSASTNYSTQGIRSETSDLIDEFGTITVNNLNEYKGMGDLLLSAAMRLPFEYKFFDFRLEGGAYLPTAAYKPPVPANTVTDYLSPFQYTVNYDYINRNGFGVPVCRFAADIKLSLAKFSALASISFQDPTKEGTNIRWEQTLTDQTFSYTSTSYKYLVDRIIIMNASLHYQAAGWFDFWLNGIYTANSKGWTEYWGVKYANPAKRLLAIEPGFELQISPSLTLYQTVGFSLAGKDTDAPTYLVTTLSYNLFPFLK